MLWIGWTLAILMFVIAFVGLIYPIIPSVVFLLVGFLLYGAFVSFEELTWLFWVIQVLFVLLLFGADTIANLVGVKRFGGSKAGMWGSTIGLLIGPFVIPVVGILAGPFLGAILAELIFTRSGIKQAFRTGIGSVVGFLTSVVVKGTIMLVMIVIFLFFLR
ncbi:DUF456 domain-containing protein [Sporosarcina sp. P21c]|uniref:DUF456 domain-containing protein n=1 Tax=Sporosarcina TaxID=1569 RepID=UPI000A14FCA5|nr:MULTISPECIES: DUF456 family protein [Sporosarcina]ARJ37412.1 hypothetical protein SporoP8_00100 [Sporosarcina ureae]PIC66962.1 DUF456 domain-containing protein [Sporosarcina sp. P16a]PIC84767.1 DUF456 domain-containing protein [Sporosarcina sp. P1]PIC89462.1 DUF456 domain-containing protein [Sporosarcina sp. P21c]PIC92414.1 DUF456 domain-containing protein [Sporosarcina sp. P25]